MLIPSVSVTTIGAAIFAVLVAVDWYVSCPEIILLAHRRIKLPTAVKRKRNRDGFLRAA